MPILNPSIQMYLLNEEDGKSSKNAINFYCRYLKIASRHIFHNLSTIEASIAFKKDLKQCISLIVRKFGCQINEVDFNNPTITDFYKYLYSNMNRIFVETNTKSQKVEGNYFKLTDNFETTFFRPNTFYSRRHSWFLSDTPIAILTISASNCKYKPDFYNLIKLEISLMKAAGFTLILCANFLNFTDFLLNLIREYEFSEIHLTSENEDNLIKFFNKTSFDFSFLKGFLYIYSPYINKKSQFREKYKKCKKIPRIKFSTFSEDIKRSIKLPFSQTIRPFSYCKEGFKHKYLRIELSNISLYDNKDDFNSFVPLETSGISQCYISPANFLNWEYDRVKVIFDDVSRNMRYYKYVNFEDLHVIKKDFYVDDPLAKGKIKLEKIDQIDVLEQKINEKIEKRRNKKFKKDYIKSLSEEKLIDNSLKYASYAYVFCENSLNNDFSFHRTQIYTALKASKSFFKDNNNTNSDNLIKQKKNLENALSTSLNDKSKELILRSILSLHRELMNLNLKNIDLDKLNNLFIRFFNKPVNYFEKLLQKNPQEALTTISELENNDESDLYKQYLESINEEILEKLSKNHKGVVYQVDTGEGKSCIICLIAAILALNGKTVHICSSNIKLANRDYMDSFDFFQQLKLKSAVLAHENELPVPPRKKEKKKRWFINEKNETKESFIKIYQNAIVGIGFEESHNLSYNHSDNEITIDSIFKENINNYYELHTKSDNSIYSKYYYCDDINYYDEEQFYNSSKMNFAVCGLNCDNSIPKNKPNIVFSTFVNFECFYLKLLELSPGYIDQYYSQCALLIDEADSILIDEIANGTIVSRDVKSNCKQVLKFVYDQRKKNKSAKKTFKKILENWPECTDLSIQDIKQMYSEIDTVNKDEFENGKKYSIEEFKVKNRSQKQKFIDEALNLAKDIAISAGKGIMDLFKSNEEEDGDDDDGDDDDDDDDDDDENEDEENKEDDGQVTVFKHIVPFDYDHKGILEPNKEFSGFIQQFIGIKESEKHQNMVIKDMSLNYLYVSHPIFVKLYNKVCGFTGTVGGQEEKKIYEQEYNLKTVTIPRNKANQRIEFPMILCDTIEDRNKSIVFEILQFHKQGNPVLVIFQDLNEIEIVAKMVYSYGIQSINFFDGKNDVVLPNRIAGIKGAISLGTNYCGRGTNILVFDKPLHVIISFYTSNERVMNQARGRTARQGQKGTVRVICLKEQFLYPKIVYDDGMKNIVNEFVIKNRIQMKYITFFQKKKPWIFSNGIDVQEFSVDDIIKMREARINVNRIVAYKFTFPLKMKVETFLNIQCQKIFSIYNCPNSKFTWRLFQKYIREMIFEAWSIKINEVDEAFFNEKKNKKYKKEIEKLNDLHLSIYSTEYQEKRKKLNHKYSKNIKEYEKVLEKSEEELICLINKYLLNDINDIPSTFMNIFNIVVNKYENDILSTFGRVSNAYLHHNKNEYLSCQIGFKPYSLLTESGARISYKNFKKTNYIKDPEMKYMKKTPKNKICLLSITEKIDDIFNLIFQKINEILGKKTFLKFFMRRTLCGCEFGICLNFPMYNQGVTDLQCIVDRDPLFLFTINVKSIIPVLAGVLIILLVYVASMTKDIGKWFMCFPAKLTKELSMKAVGIVISTFAEELFHFGLDKIIDLLKDTLNNQLIKLRSIDSEKATNAAELISNLKSLFTSKIGQKINKKFSDFLGSKIQATVNWQKLLKSCIDPERIMKISFYIILCIATFIMHFSCRKNAIEKAQKDSNEFESSFKENLNSKKEKRNKKKIKGTINSISAKEEKEMEKEKLKKNDNIEENYYENEEEEFDEETQNLSKKEIKEIEKQKKNEMHSLVDKMSKIYIYKFYSFDPLNMINNFTDFTKKVLVKNEISSGITIINCSMKIGVIKKEFLRLHYERIDKKIFLNQIRFYATNKFPSILNIVGYSINKEKFDLYFDNICISTLEILMQSHKEKFTTTNKIIIAYGIASALNYLHCHHIAHLGIKPHNILLDSSLFPYLTGFNNAEFNNDSTSLHFDVFNFGLILVFLINEYDPFPNSTGSFLLKLIEKSNSYLDRCGNYHLADLVKKCLNIDNTMQFSEICDSLELIALNDSSINTREFKKYQKIFKNRINDDEINFEFKKKIPKVEKEIKETTIETMMPCDDLPQDF